MASQSRDTNPVQVDARPENIICATEKLFSEMAKQAIAKKEKLRLEKTMKQVCNFLASERISPECNLEQRENERERERVS